MRAEERETGAREEEREIRGEIERDRDTGSERVRVEERERQGARE